MDPIGSAILFWCLVSSNYAMIAEQLTAIEAKIAALWDAGELPYLVHMSGGNEEILLDIFEGIKPTDWVLSSHRSHYHYLLHGGTEEELIAKVKAGKSMFLYGPRFLTSSIVAGMACIAAGIALDIQRDGGSEMVYCFLGDGASEEGHFYESVRFVNDRNLPCQFIIEDNDLSSGVTKAQRGVKRWQWPDCVTYYEYKPTYQHAGTGSRPKLKLCQPS